MFRHTLIVTLIACLCLQAAPVRADRIKDVASFAGVRSNQLIGVGLVALTESFRPETP